MQVMILAAGFGTRLLPYTRLKPKPLFPVLTIPLLQLTIEMLRDAGFDHIIVNGHHLQEQLKSLVSRYQGVIFQEEKRILGTGGGLREALPAMRDEPILITNGDIYHGVDLVKLYQDFQEVEGDVLLALHDHSRFNMVGVAGNNIVDFDSKELPGSLAFTGLHLINPGILQSITPGRCSCIIERYKTMLKAGEKIQYTRMDGSYWADMGTVEDYLLLHGQIFAGLAPCLPGLTLKKNSNTTVAKEARIGNNFTVEGWASIGKASIGDNVTISRSVVWDGAVIPSGVRIEDRVVTPASGNA